jgi:pyruvate-ferredoxin/flavodoxin oxidoreductase
MRVVQRGFDEVREVPHGRSPWRSPAARRRRRSEAAGDGRELPKSQAAIADMHRFWEQTGSFYARGMGNDNITDPFIGLGVMPASTALFRDMTSIRFEHPDWIAENCTACGKCYTVCPGHRHSRPGERGRRGLRHRPEARPQARRGAAPPAQGGALWSSATCACCSTPPSRPRSGRRLLAEAIDKRSPRARSRARSAKRWARRWRSSAGARRLPFALTRPYFTRAGTARGGHRAVCCRSRSTPTPARAAWSASRSARTTRCARCRQSDASVKKLREHWDFWLDLPNTPKKYGRIDDLEQGIGALET